MTLQFDDDTPVWIRYSVDGMEKEYRGPADPFFAAYHGALLSVTIFFGPDHSLWIVPES